MSGLLAALNAGKTSMFVNQKQIEITSNNINNVNTPGYSRQKAVISAVPTLEYNGYFVGQGVKITGIEREYDTFLSKQIINRNATLGEEYAKSSPLAELERVFNMGEQNLGAEISRFFDAWNELTTNPSGKIERNSVQQRGELLAGTFHDISSELDAIADNVHTAVYAKVDALNMKLTQVAELNYEISSIESTGMAANGARDERDRLLEDLTYNLGIQTYSEDTGMVAVQLPGGLPLVQGNQALSLKGSLVGSTLTLEIESPGSGATLPINTVNLGGEFKGLINISDELIPQLKNDVDTLAYNLATAINTQHKLGTDLGGNTGVDFFVDLAGVTTNASKNISIAITNADQIAAGATAAPGDNTNAQAIAALIDSPVINGTDTFEDYYSIITSDVGIAANQNNLNLQGTEDALVLLRNMRDGKVGVSLEEEMINLLQFQQGFEAAAKLLSTVDEMLTTLISIKR